MAAITAEGNTNTVIIIMMGIGIEATIIMTTIGTDLEPTSHFDMGS